MKYRYENFGGIIAHDNPPFLAFVDKTMMKELGYGDTKLWEDENDAIGILSAPTEVHFAITNQCENQCSHCYMDSVTTDRNEMDTGLIKKALDNMKEAGVFHVALGGGEAMQRKDLFEIAEYARAIGLVPNLTISGKYVTSAMAKKMKVFGQINLSIDCLKNKQNLFRNDGLFRTADNAISLLLREGINAGINFVVAKSNFDEIPTLFKYGKEKKVNEIEFLRLKPVGRGKDLYAEEKTTYLQNINLIPLLSKYSRKHRVLAKIDCSFIPMLCYHKPPRKYLYKTATYGCEAGNVLLGAKSNGKVNGCSFLPESDLTLFDFNQNWHQSEYLQNLRSWINNAPKPCCDCKYLDICKGGCRAVALHVYGDSNQYDPECPIIVEYNKKKEGSYE